MRIELEERQCDKDNKSHFVDARQLRKEQDEMLLRGYKLIQQAWKKYANTFIGILFVTWLLIRTCKSK